MVAKLIELHAFIVDQYGESEGTEELADLIAKATGGGLMPKPTEGSWIHDGLTIYDYDTGLVVARVSMTLGAQDLVRANRIAAAPDMEKALEVVERLGVGGINIPTKDMIRAVLAKAKGEADA